MTENEPAFEAADRPPMPDLIVELQNGDPLWLGDFHGQIVILSFVPQGCGDPCAQQQTTLAAVQHQVNISPMKEMVTFVTVHDANAPIEAPWDSVNWKLVVTSEGATAAAAADRFASLSGRDAAFPMAHVIDRNGRHGGIFHGAEFQMINLNIYVNGLTNKATRRGRRSRRLGGSS